MNTTRDCGCKGYRTCLVCETTFLIKEKTFSTDNQLVYVYCPWCNKAFESSDADSYKSHPNHSGSSINYPGVYIQTDFITEQEEADLMKCIDEMSWNLSQSGRRKQNYGPKTNFKKKKLNMGNFKGFPSFSKFIQDRFKTVPLLNDYRTIEQCSLEYDPSRGASIDPHIDDCWIWGERIVTVNCLSDSVLTMTPYKGDLSKYNLLECSTYHRILNSQGVLKSDREHDTKESKRETIYENIVVKLPMPRRSLIVLFGSARYNWEHCVLRGDIKQRRVCLAYREFTPPYLPGGEYENQGSEILDTANSFWNYKLVGECFLNKSID